MSDSPDALVQQIAELEATLKLSLPDVARHPLEAELARLCAARDVVTGTTNVSGTVNGAAVGVNLGTIIYGRDPSEDERRRLVWYLDALAGDLRCLPLRGLDTNLAQATNASAHSAGISLAQVYVMVATTQTCV